jgi:hypothetical protein
MPHHQNRIPLDLCHDVQWASATVCFDRKAEGWRLPGGALTYSRNRALFVAKQMADLIGPMSIAKRAA